MSAYNAGHQFGVLDINEDGHINKFREKTQGGGMINIGFIVCQPEFIDYIEGDSTVLEKAPLECAAREGQLMDYNREGFWGCMDTVCEKEELEKMWSAGQAPWKNW